MKQAYIGLGSNLADPKSQIKAALAAISGIENVSLSKVSSLYGSKPMGPQDQPDYLNAVALIQTDLEPLDLLDRLQDIEQNHGRDRSGQRWGARTLDLDILMIEDNVIQHPKLSVPHVGVLEREFVVYPLLEITPDAKWIDGESLAVKAQGLPMNGLTKLEKL